MRWLPYLLALGFVSGPATVFSATSTDGAPAMKSAWFTAEKVDEGTWRIVDHATVNVYLVLGRDRAALIDTGYGQANLLQYVRSFSSLPLTVINTHGHGDHSGADLQFGAVRAHPADFVGIERTASRQRERGRDPQVPAGEQFDYGADAKALELTALKDGEIIDLGGRQLEIIGTPGHTPGEVVLLDRERKLLFGGDHINRLVWLQLRECLPLEAYLASLEKVWARHAEFTTILPGHNEPFDRGVLEEKIACVKGILDGTLRAEVYEHDFAPGLIGKFKRSSVVFDPQNLRAKKSGAQSSRAGAHRPQPGPDGVAAGFAGN